MIRESNESDRRLLTFPAVHPCEGISLPTLFTSLFTISSRICSFKSKVFSSNKKNARKAIRMIEVLQIFLEEILDQRWGVPDSVILSLSELHLTFQKLQFLLEDCTREGSRLYMLMESNRVATHFQVLSRSVVTALDVFPFSSTEISEEVKEQVELILKQARVGDFEVELEDKRAMMGVLSILNQFENTIIPSESNLRWILDHIGVRRWSECNKEIKFLDAEVGYERMKEDKGKLAVLSSLMWFMCYCRCVVIEVVDNGEDYPKSDCGKEREILNWCFNPGDFLCPISLEVMNDPVTIETGHTYDRSSILKWFGSGSLICPKTGKSLSSIELLPNLVLRRLIHRYCSKNGIPMADIGRRTRDRDNKATSQPGSFAAQEAMKMLASFLCGKLHNEAEVERNRAAYEIRVLAKRNIFNRSCFVESGTIPYLLRWLSSRNPTTQENAIAALLNLSKHPKSRSIMVQNGGLELIVSVCKKGMKLESRDHAAATLYYLASDEENRRLIGEEPEAIPSLINLLKDGSDRGKKNGLVAIFGLLFHPENHKRVLEAKAIPLLVSILKTCQREELVTDSLAVLATLAEKSAGAMAILQNGALHPTIEILNSSSTSRVGKEQCASLLLSLSVNGGANVVALLVKIPSLMGSLYSLLSEGTSRASKKASALIRVLHDFCERRPSGFKTPVLPQEQFVHVW
ncbi:U-box domain-containing protein 19 [Prosopis cineraria]|uniref:U-box domain-containing protein 19 n=1 Tax=Prosopis cineraria TaxID=364024 RepID=UPI00240FEB63|nr:U-box domain-containing protein 19 [Prosopis cineraria]